MNWKTKPVDSPAGDRLREEQEHSITLVCPAVSLIKQLTKEVKALRDQLSERGGINEGLLDNADLLKEFKISRSTAYQWRAAGLSYFKKGSKLYYNRSEVTLFLSKYKQSGF